MADGQRPNDFGGRQKTWEGYTDRVSHPSAPSKAGRIAAIWKPSHPLCPFCDSCHTCGKAPPDHDGPKPALIAFCHRPGLAPRHLASVTDPLGCYRSGNAVSPPLVTGHTGGFDPACLAAVYRGRGACHGRPRSRPEGIRSKGSLASAPGFRSHPVQPNVTKLASAPEFTSQNPSKSRSGQASWRSSPPAIQQTER